MGNLQKSNGRTEPGIKMLTLLTAFLLTMSMSNFSVAEEGEDKVVDFTAVKKSYFDNCAYIGETGLEINYELWSADTKSLVITGLDPDGYSSELLRETVARGRGNLTVFFEAGTCQQSINIHLE